MRGFLRPLEQFHDLPALWMNKCTVFFVCGPGNDGVELETRILIRRCLPMPSLTLNSDKSAPTNE